MKKTASFRLSLALFLGLLFTSFSLSAQKLERKGTLGIQMENNEEGDGLHVRAVIPNTTASKLTSDRLSP